LSESKPARTVELDDEEEAAIKGLGLLTRKKMIYAANVADSDLATGNELSNKLQKHAEAEGSTMVLVSAQVEAELVDLDEADKNDFLDSLGVTSDDCGLRRVIREAYSILDLQTYFTSGPTETRAWTFKRGWKAPKAAGVIHGDFERGFIRAETISYEDLVEHGSEAECKKQGKLRSEGKGELQVVCLACRFTSSVFNDLLHCVVLFIDYTVMEGDVILFRFNV
jgi:ribosome-binding ATPase YchF (GTP1/OBG family)